MNLKCAIPVFEGLLPEPHNTYVLKILFDLAHWHGLAKLRMHTDPTLELLAQVTISLGSNLRTFEKHTCSLFQTRELDRERAARQRRQEKDQAAKKKITNCGNGRKTTETSNLSTTRKPKQLNLKTYKYHALGDYVDTIKRYGTSDSYSTQGVSFQLSLILFNFNGITVYLRANSSTESQRRAFFAQVADQYLSSCLELSDVSAISKRSVRKDFAGQMYRCLDRRKRKLSPALQSSTTLESHRNFTCIYQHSCRRMKVIRRSRRVLVPLLF